MGLLLLPPVPLYTNYYEGNGNPSPLLRETVPRLICQRSVGEPMLEV
jgi:hypothetical protein